MLACQWRFLNYKLRAYTRFLLFPKWDEFTGSGEGKSCKVLDNL